jgi:hypothetical protein
MNRTVNGRSAKSKGDLELQAGIEHDAGFSYAPITPPQPHTYPAVTKAFASTGRYGHCRPTLEPLTALAPFDPFLAQTLALSPLSKASV